MSSVSSDTVNMSQAAVYEKLGYHQREDGLNLIAKLCQNHQGTSMKVLDIGCGTGYLSSVWATKTSSCVNAVDPDDERIALAQETYGGISNLSFCEGTAERFPVDEEQYDIVFSNYVFHWVEDKGAAFAKIYKSLKPGGVFGLTTVLDRSLFLDEMVELMPTKEKEKVFSKFHFRPKKFYEDTAFSCNFSILSMDSFLRKYKFNNFDETVKFLYAVTHGNFQPDFVEKTKLESLNHQFGDGPVEFDLSNILIMILQKN